MNHKSSSLNGSTNMSDSFQESLDNDIDCDTLVNDSANETQSTSAKISKQTNSSHTQQLTALVVYPTVAWALTQKLGVVKYF